MKSYRRVLQISDGFNSILHGYPNSHARKVLEKNKITSDYQNASQERLFDGLVNYLRAELEKEFSRLALYRKLSFKTDESDTDRDKAFEMQFYYLFFPDEKDILTNWRVGSSSNVWKSVHRKRRIIHTPTRGPKQDPRPTGRTGRKIDFMITDPLYFNGIPFGAAQHVLLTEPDKYLRCLCSEVSAAINDYIHGVWKREELGEIIHDIRSTFSAVYGSIETINHSLFGGIDVELIRKARDGIKETQDKLSETKFNEDATSQVMSDLSAIGTLLDNISENKEEAIEMFNAVRSYFQSVREMMGDYFTSQGSVFRESSYSTMNINKLVGLLGAKIQKAKMIYGQPVEYSSQNDTTLPEQFLDKGRLLNFVLWEIAQEGAEILLERKQCPDFNIRQGEPYVFSVITSREAFQDGQEFSVIHTKDNARGMPPEVARKIEKGERVSHHDIAGRNREQVGGFGMSSAYRIIREHGGFWKVESGQGTGAEFKIYLPIKTER